MLAKRTFPFAGEEREAMLAVFRQALAWGRAYAPACLGMACPGPFDFARGVSHMRHKWRGLKDVPLPPVFARELPGYPSASCTTPRPSSWGRPGRGRRRR